MSLLSFYLDLDRGVDGSIGAPGAVSAAVDGSVVAEEDALGIMRLGNRVVTKEERKGEDTPTDQQWPD